MNRVRWLWMALLIGGLAAAAQAGPDAATAFEQGNALARSRDFEAAIAAYAEALRLDPTLAAAWINRGNLRVCRQEFEHALADYDQALRLQPLSAVAFINRGLAHTGNHAGARAVADLDEALRLSPELDAQKLSFLASATNADACFDLGVVRPLPSYGQAYYQRGNGHFRALAADLAIADYTAALRFQPDDARTLVNRGAAHAGLRYFDRASEDFNAAVRLDPNGAAGYYGRGVLALYQREFERAIADFTEAISLEPSHAAAYNGRSLAWHAAGNKEQAKADFHKALRLDLDDHLAVHGCAQGFFRNCCETLALKCRTRPRRTAELRNFEDAIPWHTLGLDLPADAPPALEVAEQPAEVSEPTETVAPTVAWVPSDAPPPVAPALLEVPDATPLAPVAVPAPTPMSVPVAAAPTPTPTPAPAAPPTIVTVPAQNYDQAAAFWYSPAPIYFTVVVAALGAAVVCVCLVLLLPHFSKSKSESVDMQQLLSALLKERGAPSWQRPLASAPAPVSAPSAPVSKAGNAEEALAQNILAENLTLREPVGSAR